MRNVGFTIKCVRTKFGKRPLSGRRICQKQRGNLISSSKEKRQHQLFKQMPKAAAGLLSVRSKGGSSETF